jgi:hypothetical protein
VRSGEKVKYIDIYSWHMNVRLLPILVALLLIFSFSAACTGTEEPSGPSPTETAQETPAPTGTPPSLIPEPTQTLPPGKEVTFEVSEGLTPTITDDLRIVFSGGKGQDFVKGIDVVVIKSTGEVVTGTMEPIKGKELIISDAKGENRVQITVSLVTGGSYKVVDRIVEVK